jgi:hypothetical protein
LFLKGATESLIQFLRHKVQRLHCVKILKAVGLLKRPKNKPVAIELNPINASRQQKANLKENLLD